MGFPKVLFFCVIFFCVMTTFVWIFLSPGFDTTGYFGINNISEVVIVEEVCRSWQSKDNSIIKCSGKLPSWKHRITNNDLTIPNVNVSKFKPKMSSMNHRFMLTMLQTFVSMCDSASIPYMISYGTLVGAVRHFGFIPWDDDIDVIIQDTYKRRLTAAMSTLTDPRFVLKEFTANHWKIRTILRSTHFIDIYFYHQNSDNITVCNDVIKNEHVYPAQWLPFGGFVLPAPHNPVAVLDQSYKDWNTTCVYKRIHTSTKLVDSAPCNDLYSIYPFVFYRYTQKTIESSLMLSDRQLITITRLRTEDYSGNT